MPQIKINLGELSGIDPDVVNLEKASVDFSPYRIFGLDEMLVTRNILRVKAPGGIATTVLPATPAGNAFEVQERNFRRARHGYVIVPDVPGPINYKDLVWVDKDTLEPDQPLDPVWVASLAAEADARASADADLQAQIDDGPTDVAWGDIDDKPATFPPTLPIAQDGVTGLPAAVASIATKASQTDLTAAQDQIALKVNTTTYTAGMAAKADQFALSAEVDARTNADALKADAAATTAALGGKADLVGGTVPASQLPSYVDDVLSFANLAAFPATGEDGKIYIAKDTNLTYRWTGAAYGVLDPSLALGETPSTAYRGDRGKAAFDHSQVITGNPHQVTKADVGLGNVNNTSDANKPVSTSQQQALDAKAPTANPTFTGTVSGVTKGHVGLGNVDNTSDANKPVSTSQQAAIDGAAGTATWTGVSGKPSTFPPDQESVEDIVGAQIVAGTNVTVAYDDPGTGKITISSTGGSGGTGTAQLRSGILTRLSTTATASLNGTRKVVMDSATRADTGFTVDATNSVITVAEPGFYLVDGHVRLSAPNAGYNSLYIVDDTSSTVLLRGNSYSATTQELAVSGFLYLAANQVINLSVQAASPIGVVGDPALPYTYFRLMKLEATGGAASGVAPAVGARSGRYDAAQFTYLPTGTNGLDRWKAKLSKIRAGSTTDRAKLAFIGHSGLTRASAGAADDLVRKIRRRYTQKAGDKMGTGAIPMTYWNDGTGTGANRDSRLTFTGTWTVTGTAPGGTSTSNDVHHWLQASTGATVTAVSDVPSATAVDIVYWNTPANTTSIGVTLNGSALASIVPTGTSVMMTKTYTGLAANTLHSLALTAVGGAQGIVSVNFYTPGDVEFSNFGLSGANVKDWLNTSVNYAAYQEALFHTPDGVVVFLGGNDMRNNVSAPTVKADLTALVTALKASGVDVMLLGGYHANGYTDAQWLPYRTALYDIADAQSVPLIDMYELQGTYAAANPLGLYYDDFHLSSAGEESPANLIASVLSAA